MTTANIGRYLYEDLYVITDPANEERDLFQSLVVRLDVHPLIRWNRDNTSRRDWADVIRQDNGR